MDSRWSIIGEPFREGNVTWVKCKCACGTIRDVRLYALKSKRPSKSCGCWRRENSRRMNRTHGQSDTRLYKIWSGMRKRCHNPAASNYHNYGGRGITVCSEWEDFQVFATWALDNDYRDTLTIERKNNNLGYLPSNCCFIPKGEQSNNRRVWGISKYQGVGFDKRWDKWYCYVGNGKTRKKLGAYKTELAAYRARNKYLKGIRHAT